MTGDHDPIQLSGTTLITGPSNAGKTRRTYAALERWLTAHGPEGVVVFDFAPVVERDGEVLGGRLTRFGEVPAEVQYGVLEAHAPRAEADSDAAAFGLAHDNATRAQTLIEAAPAAPRAVFVNDATIPFQHSSGDLRGFLAYCAGADCAVLNAFESDELGSSDPVSRHERLALDTLTTWAECVVELG